jgi:hypothetical protein
MLTLVVSCPACAGHIASILVDGDDWHEAETWALVAAAGHQDECTGRLGADPPAELMGGALHDTRNAAADHRPGPAAG